MRSKSFAPKTKPTVNDLVNILQSERRIFSCNELKKTLWAGDCRPQDLSILATEARDMGHEMKYYHSVGWGMGFTPHPRDLLIEAHLAIFNYISDHPDCRTRDVYKDLDLDPAWVRGELSISPSAMPARLKRAGASEVIDSYRNGNFRYWFVRANGISPTQSRILELLEANGRASYDELIECLPISERTEGVMGHIKIIRSARPDLRIKNVCGYGYVIPQNKGDLVGGEMQLKAIKFLQKRPRTLNELANYLWPWKPGSAYSSAAVMKSALKKSGAIFLEKGGRGRKQFHLIGWEPLEDAA